MRLFARVPLTRNPEELVWQSESFPDFLSQGYHMFIGFRLLMMCSDTETLSIIYKFV